MEFLSSQLRKLWELKSLPTLIGLGKGFYSIKLPTIEGVQKLLEDGPWFENGYYLSVRRWEPEFRPSTAKCTSVPKWYDLSELPVEFHHLDVFKAIGNAIGKFAKADFKGAELNRASYARICCQVDEETPTPTSVWIGGFKKTLIDAAFYNMCSVCNGVQSINHLLTIKNSRDLKWCLKDVC